MYKYCIGIVSEKRQDGKPFRVRECDWRRDAKRKIKSLVIAEKHQVRGFWQAYLARISQLVFEYSEKR